MIEFVIVDFGSRDGLQNWVLSNYRKELDEGYLRYFFTNRMEGWHASIAKNTAHYYARGEILINLDGDNFTGRDGGAYINDQFLKYGDKLLSHQYDGVQGQGTYGRIGMYSKFFHKIGGYDESFHPMGHQDLDLIRRLEEFGLTYKRFDNPEYARSIHNTKAESIKHCDSTLSWGQMERANARLSLTNLSTGNLIANGGIFGYRNDVFTWRNGQISNP